MGRFYTYTYMNIDVDALLLKHISVPNTEIRSVVLEIKHDDGSGIISE